MITANDLDALMYDLPILVTATRTRRGLSFRAAGRAIGIASSTVYRIEQGLDCDVCTLRKILRWIGP